MLGVSSASVGLYRDCHLKLQQCTSTTWAAWRQLAAANILPAIAWLHMRGVHQQSSEAWQPVTYCFVTAVITNGLFHHLNTPCKALELLLGHIVAALGFSRLQALGFSRLQAPGGFIVIRYRFCACSAAALALGQLTVNIRVL